MDILIYIAVFYFGAIFGSFLNVVILRLPKKLSLRGRSSCPACGHELSALELLPLFSFLWLKGKCKTCKTKISPRYFAIEFVTGLLFLLSWLYFSQTPQHEYLLFIKYVFALSALLVIFVIDFEHFLILDKVLITAFAGIAFLNLLIDLTYNIRLLSVESNFAGGIFAGFIAAAPFFLVWYVSKGTWMGFGDVKLALLLGNIFAWPLVLVNIMVGVILGGIIAIVLLVLKKKKLKSQVPFGTFLSLGGFVTLFWGKELLNWYLSILGF